MAKRILIVDDSEAIRHSLKFSLSMRKYQVVAVSNVNEAILFLYKNQDIDLVITDMHMPGMSGLDFIRYIKRDLKLPKLPVIVLTTDEEIGKEAIARGASAFIVKSSKASAEILRFVSMYLS